MLTLQGVIQEFAFEAVRHQLGISNNRAEGFGCPFRAEPQLRLFFCDWKEAVRRPLTTLYYTLHVSHFVLAFLLLTLHS